LYYFARVRWAHDEKYKEGERPPQAKFLKSLPIESETVFDLT
jgi:hypothetical protein